MDNFQTGGNIVPELDKAKNQDFSEWITDLRGRKVILDYQLATLYGVETKNLKRAVKANMNRFPPDFMFERTAEEFHALRCKNFTSNGRGGTRYMPFAFTQEDTLREQNDINEDTMMQLQLINESIARMQAENTEKQTKRKRIGFK